MRQDILFAVQVVLAVVLIILILVQVKGTGFGRVWGSGASSFSRRGLEKLVFKLTFVVVLLFLVISLASIV